jgi:hypothetical protein
MADRVPSHGPGESASPIREGSASGRPCHGPEMFATSSRSLDGPEPPAGTLLLTEGIASTAVSPFY